MPMGIQRTGRWLIPPHNLNLGLELTDNLVLFISAPLFWPLKFAVTIAHFMPSAFILQACDGRSCLWWDAMTPLWGQQRKLCFSCDIVFTSKLIEIEFTHISLWSRLLENSESNLQQSSSYCNGLYNFYLCVLKTPHLI